MFRNLLRRLLPTVAGASRPIPPPELPEVDIPASVFVVREGFPQVDWDLASLWATRTAGPAQDAAILRRAVAAAWVERIAESARGEHACWRRADVEGVAPIASGLQGRIAAACEKSFAHLRRTLQPILGDETPGVVCVVALADREDYYSFLSHFVADGDFATSAGTYIREGQPTLALPARADLHLEPTIAHELTHHFLAAASLPLWLEEGLTQMMEERVTGYAGFQFDRETARRHVRHWTDHTLEGFWSGEAFGSPDEDEQELAYNLSQALVRPLLADAPQPFFRFARACRDTEPGQAAEQHLGLTLGTLASRVLGPGEWEPAYGSR